VARSKSGSTQPIGLASANLSPARIGAAIAQLEARMADLNGFQVDAIRSFKNPAIAVMRSAIDATLTRIFGRDTHDYHRLMAAKDLAAIDYGEAVTLGSFGVDPPALQIQSIVERGRQRATALLTKEVALLTEQLGEDGSSAADRAIRAYSNLDLHPEIARAASGLYRDGHYANAIENAVKALNGLVRLRSGDELDGVPLMQQAFSPKAPALRFNELKDQSDRDEQLGFMMMFSGALAGLRNPRAHKLIKDDPERALEFIAFVSLLAKLLDGATKTPPP